MNLKECIREEQEAWDRYIDIKKDPKTRDLQEFYYDEYKKKNEILIQKLDENIAEDD